MGRPRTPIGTFGEFTYVKTANGQVQARTRFRDDDGQVRRVSATGATRKAAERALKAVVAQRGSHVAAGELTGDSTFARLVEVWLADLDLEGKLAPSTRALYERNMRQLEVEAIRRAVREWRRGSGLSGPKPDGQLEAIIEVMLGTSARIGEVLAIRRRDVDVTVSPATLRICGTIVSPAGKPTHRQAHPKTASSTRTVSVQSFTAAVLRQRLVLIAHEDPEHLIFFSRNGTPLTTNNVRRRLRAVLADIGITRVTPHSFRRTVATVIDRAGGADLAAEMLGHTSSQITKKHYIEPDDTVNPVTAEILEALAPRTFAAEKDDGSAG